MFDLVIDKLHDTHFLTMVLAAIAASATVITLAMPLFATDNLGRRLKTVAIEREKIRQRERDRLARGQKVSLRQSPKQYMKAVVERFNLAKWVGQEEARIKLVQAGYRGQAAYITFLFFRMTAPIAALLFAVFYVFVLVELNQPPLVKIGICLAATYVGLQLPSLMLKNQITRRQLQIRRAFPDALDLLLICVESGMSVEAAFRKVSQEIGNQSIALAEELTLTTAELSYLQDRRQGGVRLAAAGRTLRDPTRPDAAGDGPGKPRHADDGSRKARRGAPAQAHRANDPVLSAGPVRRDSRPGGDPRHGTPLKGPSLRPAMSNAPRSVALGSGRGERIV